MQPRAFRLLGVVSLALFFCRPAVGGDDSRVWFVPWKVLEPGAEPSPAFLTLYWIPSSPDELRRSSLVTSRALAGYAGRCVAMQVIRADDGVRLELVRAGRELPLALLIAEGAEVGRVQKGGDPLDAEPVEAMVRDAIDTREAAAAGLLDRARRALADGNRLHAVALYRQVCEQRCTFPRQAKEAQRALRKLGER